MVHTTDTYSQPVAIRAWTGVAQCAASYIDGCSLDGEANSEDYLGHD